MVIRAYVQAYGRYPTQAELNAADSSMALISYSDSDSSLLTYLKSPAPRGGGPDPQAAKMKTTLQPVAGAPYSEGALTLPGGSLADCSRIFR